MPDVLSLYRLLIEQPATVAFAAVALLLAAVLLFRRQRPWHAHLRPKPLLTANEREFFHRLQKALPGLHVFPQVSFATFITDDGALSGKARWSVRARFDRKIADFVLCERGTLKVLALVELDDRTHTATADRQRDAITKAAGYRTIRFQSKHKPTAAEIAALFQPAAGWNSLNPAE